MSFPADPLTAAAVLLAGQHPRGWQRLKAAHIADAGGYCGACRQAASGAAPVWPCRLAVIAAQAEELSRGRQGGTDGVVAGTAQPRTSTTRPAAARSSAGPPGSSRNAASGAGSADPTPSAAAVAASATP